MTYYQIEFEYQGPKSGVNPTDESSAALSKAILEVESMLKIHKIDGYKCYSWPDGSLFYVIRTDLGIPDVKLALTGEFVVPFSFNDVNSTDKARDWDDKSPTYEEILDGTKA